MTRTTRALIALLLIVGATAIAACGSSGGTTKGLTHIVVNTTENTARFRAQVASPETGEIHVHGYNFHKDVPAGGTVSFDFPAKIDGSFIVELEKPGVQIASLQVNP